MANPSKQRGTEWESRVRDGVRKRGGKAERIALSGGGDEGDLVLEWFDRDGSNRMAVIEAKATKHFDFSGFVNQAIEERDHYCAKRGIDPRTVEAVAFVKRRNHPWQKGFAITTIDEYLRSE